MHNPNSGTILLTLIQGEEGKKWAADKKGWTSFTADPVCTWEGVLCDEESGVVVEAIFLPKAGLPGTIPSVLGMLPSLKAITIPEGKLRGSIPEEVAKLPNLEIVNLSQNQLTGTIPNFDSDKLRSLDLGYNAFTGTISLDLCENKNKMTDFDLIHNKLSGTIPSCFSNMGNLVTLSLSENRLSGTIPSSLGELIVLEYLYLDNNYLMGMIPPAIARPQSSLREFWLQENLLSGTIPASIADVSNLKDFYVDGNKFTGIVPTDLCRFDINADFFEDVDSSINRDYCQSIACPVNTVSAEGVYPCVPCKTKFYNPYLGRIGACTTLNQREILNDLFQSTNGQTWIGASNWASEDTFICDFTGVSCDANNHIFSIDLKGRGLTGTLPGSIGFLKYLTYLDLSDNNLTGFLPSDLRWAPLESLDISGNKIRGIVPNTLCLKAFVNGNGEQGEYTCDKIACPAGTYSHKGYHDADDFSECFKCLDDSAEFLGLKTCHNKGHQYVYNHFGAFVAFMFFFGLIGFMVYMLVRNASKIHEDYEMASKTEREPSLSSNATLDVNADNTTVVPKYSDLTSTIREDDDNSFEKSLSRSPSPTERVLSPTQNSKKKRGSTVDLKNTTDWLDVPDIT